MEKYEILKCCGSGSYGSCYQVRDKLDNSLWCVKAFKEAHKDSMALRHAMREAKLLQTLSHPNIVKLQEAYRTESRRIYLVMEYVPKTLSHELRMSTGGMPIARARSIMQQLLSAIAFLHKNQVVHRDIKPANILMHEDDTLKLCDFGFATSTRKGAATVAQTAYVVTRWYRAPEVLVADRYGAAVDIWAAGCIFWELVTGTVLLPGRSHLDQIGLTLQCLGDFTPRQMEKLRQGLVDNDAQSFVPQQTVPLEDRLLCSGFTPDMIDVLCACLAVDPLKRATAAQLLAMPFFTGAGMRMQPQLDGPSCRSSSAFNCSLPESDSERLPCISRTINSSRLSHLSDCGGAPRQADYARSSTSTLELRTRDDSSKPLLQAACRSLTSSELNFPKPDPSTEGLKSVEYSYRAPAPTPVTHLKHSVSSYDFPAQPDTESATASQNRQLFSRSDRPSGLQGPHPPASRAAAGTVVVQPVEPRQHQRTLGIRQRRMRSLHNLAGKQPTSTTSSSDGGSDTGGCSPDAGACKDRVQAMPGELTGSRPGSQETPQSGGQWSCEEAAHHSVAPAPSKAAQISALAKLKLDVPVTGTALAAVMHMCQPGAALHLGGLGSKVQANQTSSGASEHSYRRLSGASYKLSQPPDASAASGSAPEGSSSGLSPDCGSQSRTVEVPRSKGARFNGWAKARAAIAAFKSGV